MAKPISSNMPWELANPILAQSLNPLLTAPQSNSVFLTNVSLQSGSNQLKHGLGRTPVGWRLSDLTSAVTLYRSQPFNDQTLTLTVSGTSTATIEVF